jgi:NADH-quinone oxidoreductase subunit M
MLVGVLYDRRHTKLISEFGGLAQVMPNYATVFAVVLMASVGLPLTIGFVGEFLSLLGFFKVSPFLTLLAGLTIILGAVYMLVMYKKVFFGGLHNPKNKTLEDIKGREMVALIPLVALIVILGIYPKPILDPVNKSVTQLVEIMQLKAVNETTKTKLISANSIGEVK